MCVRWRIKILFTFFFAWSFCSAFCCWHFTEDRNLAGSFAVHFPAWLFLSVRWNNSKKKSIIFLFCPKIMIFCCCFPFNFRQLILILELYSPNDVYDYLMHIALKLCADQVSEVRWISFKLVRNQGICSVIFTNRNVDVSSILTLLIFLGLLCQLTYETSF